MEQPTSSFDYAFSLFGLLLGFSLVEVLGGFARTVRTHKYSAIGHLVPMLGLIVMLDLISFWTILWHARTDIPVKTLSLFLGFLISGIYFFAASSIFPEQPRIADWDGHFQKIRRLVAGAILGCNLLTYALVSWLKGSLPNPDTMLVIGIFTTLYLLLMAVPRAWIRTQHWLLGLLVFAYWAEAVWFFT